MDYAEVACGYQHCCGLVAEGYGGTAARTVKCWGSNQFGQLLAPTDGTRALPAAALAQCGWEAQQLHDAFIPLRY